PSMSVTLIASASAIDAGHSTPNSGQDAEQIPSRAALPSRSTYCCRSRKDFSRNDCVPTRTFKRWVSYPGMSALLTLIRQKSGRMGERLFDSVEQAFGSGVTTQSQHGSPAWA